MRPVHLALVLSMVACAAPVAAPDPANATFQIERTTITLSAGRAETPVAPGSAAKAVTLLGARAIGDVDGDGRDDVAAVLVHQPGGSGTFSYAAVLLNPATGVKATNAVLIGDRVTVQGVRLDGRTVVVDYLDRRAGEAFAVVPSVPTTKRFVIRDGALVLA